MQLDFQLFDLINGLAGRWAALDALGRVLGIYGLLGVLLVVLALLWWPHWDSVTRRRYLLALLASIALCAVLAGLEAFVSQHHNIRARPANARWATILISAGSELSFPAWSVVLAFALQVPSFRLARRVGLVLAALGTLLALALVYCGVNYPLDVLTGVLLGLAIGFTATLLTGLHRPARPWPRLAVVWGALAVWAVLLFITIKPASTLDDAHVATGALSVTVTPPTRVLTAISAAVRQSQVEMTAATNGHLLVAAVTVREPSPDVPLTRVTNDARHVVNAAFTSWPQLDFVTISVLAGFPRETGVKVGTLYTATLARQGWPAGGYTATQALPGKKFFHPRFYR